MLVDGKPLDIVSRCRTVIVSAEVKLTHPAEVKVTHLGEDDGFLSRRDVDPGASGGDSGSGTTRSLDSADYERDGVVA
jgi:hypothetical protein